MKKDLPKGWATSKIGDLCLLNPRHPKGLDTTTLVTFVPMAAVGDVSGRIERYESRPFEEVKRGYTQFKDGDVLWAKITPCMENGKAAVARELSNGIGCGTTEFYVLRSQGSVLPSYLHRFMRQGSFRQAAKETMQSGVGQARVPKAFVLNSELLLPPLNEQRRIVAKLDALQARLDAARAALDAVPALLKRYRQSVLAAAFRGDLTADWRAQNPDVEPATELLARIRVERKRRWIEDYTETNTRRAQKRAEKQGKQWSETDEAKARKQHRKKAEGRYEEPAPPYGEAKDLYDLPPSWSWTTTEMVGEITNGRQRVNPQPGKKGSPYLRIANVQDDVLVFDDVNEMLSDPQQDEFYRLQAGDILVSAGQSLERVGQSAMFRVEMPTVGFQKNLYRVRPFDGFVCCEHIQQVFRAWVRLGFFKRRSSITTNLAYMTTSKFGRCPFPLPPLDEQMVLSEIVQNMLLRSSAVEAQVASLTGVLNRLQQSLLAKAFRGELVPQDPADEPASALLARIQAERTAAKKKR